MVEGSQAATVGPGTAVLRSGRSVASDVDENRVKCWKRMIEHAIILVRLDNSLQLSSYFSAKFCHGHFNAVNLTTREMSVYSCDCQACAYPAILRMKLITCWHRTSISNSHGHYSEEQRNGCRWRKLPACGGSASRALAAALLPMLPELPSVLIAVPQECGEYARSRSVACRSALSGSSLFPECSPSTTMRVGKGGPERVARYLTGAKPHARVHFIN